MPQPPVRPAPCRLALALLAAWPALAQAQSQDQGADSGIVARVEIIGSAPLPAIGQPRRELAAPVQRADAAAIAASGALELGEFLNRRLGSVHVNDMQGNPFQMDVSYRGYSASPLLGSAQGISVYVDGVRINQPFGDVVSWDLLPRAAIASIELMPGSNPVFGLNTLGGALAVHTKDGRTYPGSAVEATVAGRGRRALEFEHGGYDERGLHWYLSGKRFSEDGWRDASASTLRQLFGKLGWQDRASSLSLSVSHADNRLGGNGLQEQALLLRQRSSVYTRPDITDNRATMLNLVGSHAIDDNLQVSANAYYRRLHSNSYNGDINENALGQSLYQPNRAEQAALAAAGYSGFPVSGANAANTPFPFWRCLGQVLLVDEPAEKCTGLINRSHSEQRNHGASAQLSWRSAGEGRRNYLVAGAAYDASRVDFGQSAQLGYLLPDRSIAAVDAFADGVSGGSIDGLPYDSRVDLAGRIRSWSVYASDTLTLGRQLHITASGRYNRSSIDNVDRLHEASDPASLSGDHRFGRFNPALGLAWTPAPDWTAYGSLSESSRAPTAVELGCANPAQPCKLPNAMAGDPPLAQVLTRTAELGLRGSSTLGQWSVGLFNAVNRDDILFVADNLAGFGYFKNFGKTRRRGLELGLESSFAAGPGKLSMAAHYTWLDATYQSAETVNGSSNSSNDAALAGVRGVDGSIAITPGDRIPLVPRHLLKLSGDYALGEALTINAGLLAVARSPARGNENGAHQADGLYYLGSGYSPGYLLANLGASLRLSQRWQLLLRVDNLFDTRYNTAAQLGVNAFDASGILVARPFADPQAQRHSTFYAPGAPRLITVGLRYALGGTPAQ